MEIFNFKFLRNIMSSIVKENLILNFETKKDQGSFWSDTSGQQNKGVFVGSPTYCPENKGSYSFNGNGQYVRLPQDFIDVTKSFSSVFVFKTKTPGIIFGQTAIPYGTYPMILNMSNRFKRILPLIQNVKGFDGIRIHGGNSAVDTLGCILLGTAVDKEHLAKSQIALGIFLSIITPRFNSGEKITITITK